MFNPDEWYFKLNKPTWTPEPKTIGLIWSVLYPIIIITYGYVFYKVIKSEIPAYILIPFIINVIANIIFTPILFRLKNLRLATLDILLVLVTIPITMYSIWTYNKYIALAQLPYLVWVSIASTLQISILRSN